MRKEVPKKIWIPLILIAVCGVAWAAVQPASRLSGVQITSNATTPVAATKQGVWVDTAALPQLRYDDGTNSNYVSAIPATTKGDLAIFNGAKWLRLGVGTNTQVLTADSTQTTGIKWATSSGTGTVTSITIGNGLSSTQSPLTTSGTMSINTAITADLSTAQELTNKTETGAVVKNGLTATGAVSNDFSGSTGTFKTSTGTNTLSGNTVIVDTDTLTCSNNSTGTTQAVAISLQNTTASTSGNQKYGPMYESKGTGFGTTGSASQTVATGWQTVPLQSTTARGAMGFFENLAGAGYTELARLYHDTASAQVILKIADLGAAQAIISGPGSAFDFFIANNSSLASSYIDLANNVIVISSAVFKPASDITTSLGLINRRYVSGWFLTMGAGGTAAEKPTCDSSLRGQMFAISAAGGASDSLQICDKSAADAYAWRTILTAP